MDQPVFSTPVLKPKSNLAFYITIAILTLLLLPSIGFNIKGLINPRVKTILQQTNPNKPNSLFTSQTANIQGKITGTNGSILTIENTAGVTGEIALAQDFTILELGSNPTAAPKKDIGDIKLNQEALLELKPNGGRFEVIIITFIPEAMPSPQENKAAGSPDRSLQPAPNPSTLTNSAAQR